MIDEIQAISDAICEYLRPHYSLHTVDITTRCRRIYVSNYPKRNRLGKNRFSQFYIALYSDKAITVMQEAVNTDLCACMYFRHDSLYIIEWRSKNAQYLETTYSDPELFAKISEFLEQWVK